MIAVIAPALVFLYHLFELGAMPFLVKESAHKILQSFHWLGYSFGAGRDHIPVPTFHRETLPFIAQEHYLFYSMIWTLMVWVFSCFAQIISYVALLLLILLTIAYLVALLGVGCILYLTKLLVVGDIWNIWFYLWTWTKDFDTKDSKGEKVDVDTVLLNQCLIVEISVESLAQFVIQIVNNALLDQWTPIAFTSMGCSCYGLCAGLYRFIYQIVFIHEPIQRFVDAAFIRIRAHTKDFGRMRREGQYCEKEEGGKEEDSICL